MTEPAVRPPPTEDPRMWDTFVGAGVVVIAVVACFAGSALATVAGIAGALAIGLGWLLVGRAAAKLDRPNVAFQVIVILGAAVAAFAYGPLGAAQALAAPLMWVSSGPSIRRAVVANVGLFDAVFAAYAVSGSSVLLLAVTQLLSFAFSMVIGLWISGLARATEERDRLIAELERAQASIARLSGERATTAERSRIARDLHDTIAQDLTAIAMLAQRSAPGAAALRTIEELAQSALAEVRGLVAASAGVGLGDGLPVALERLGARFEAKTGIAVTVDAAPIELPVDAEVALLRTAQEALANVRKHAAATRVAMSLVADAAGARLEVRDDGRGFDRASVTRGLGLLGLDERIALAGGSLHIASGAAGTTVTARLASGGAA
ncbi:MAG: sensor histidine kinase [Actinomycetota bacterium]